MVNIKYSFQKRLEKVQNLLLKLDLDFFIITNIQNLYWITGTAQYGVLVVSREDYPVFFIRRNLFLAKKESWLENIREMEKTSQVKEYLTSKGRNLDNLKIGMELNSLPASFYLYYRKMLKGADLSNVEYDLRKLRMVKDQKELDIFRTAGKVAQKAQEIIPEKLIPGIKEHEVAAEIIKVALKNKSVHFSNVNSTFGQNWFILTSGENLWTPSYFPILSGTGLSNAIPYGYSDRIIKKGDIVMCDYAINYMGYHADHARTYYVQSIPDKFKERYLILKRAYDIITQDYLRAGTPANQIFLEMKKLLEKENLGNYFQGNGYYYQGLGHGIGLELDELPNITEKDTIVLEENMVIALEPKIIIPNWGAIDLEDDFIIKKGKPERITHTEYLFD